MKSYNHKCIKACSSMKVSLLYILIIYELIIILFHLQIMSIFYFTYSTVCRPQEVVSVTLSTTIHNGFNINNYYIHYYKNVFAHNFYYYAYDSNTTSTISSFQLPCSEDTNAHAQLNSTWLD